MTGYDSSWTLFTTRNYSCPSLHAHPPNTPNHFNMIKSLHTACHVHIHLYFLEQSNSYAGNDLGLIRTLKLSIHWKVTFFVCVSPNHTFASTYVVNCTLLGLFHQIIDVDMEIIIKLDEIHRGFGFDLVNDLACPFGAIFFGIFHMFTY